MNELQGNLFIFWIDIALGLQKLATILENKVPPNLKVAKHDINKSCLSTVKSRVLTRITNSKIYFLSKVYST